MLRSERLHIIIFFTLKKEMEVLIIPAVFVQHFHQI